VPETPDITTETVSQKRRNPYRPAVVDGRTRIARRQRAIERELRAQLTAQGRTILIHDDIQIGALADCMVKMEILRGEASRGHAIDDEQLTRYANIAQRLVSALGLRPTVQPPGPSLREYLTSKAAEVSRGPSA
jgi:hypothetical protein